MVGSQRLSSPPLNMQCALSSPYLGWSGRGAHALACVLVVTFFSELGQHNVSYFSLISFPVLGAIDRVALNIPIILWNRDVLFGMTHCRKSPQITLVMLHEVVLSDSMAPLNGLHVFLSWMDATPLSSQQYKRWCREGSSSKTIDTDIISIHPLCLQ